MSDQAFFTDTYIRMMCAEDISAVYAVQQACYVPQMVEPEALIRQRWQQVADTSWVACDSVGPAAYLVAYRSLKNKVSALGEAFRHAECPDTLYLHDMAVHPRLRGSGIAGRLLASAHEYARANGLSWLALVSVQDTLTFWRKLGFEPVVADADQQPVLATYTGPACYCLLPVAD